VARDAETIDAFVSEAVLTRLEASELGPLVPDSDVDIAALRKEANTVASKLAHLAESWAKDEITRPEWDVARAALEERRRRIGRQLDIARRQSAAAAIAGPSVREAWGGLDLDGRRAVIRELLPDGIVINPIGRGRWRSFDPASVELRWVDQ
jgi:hypothetical protein